VRPNTVATASSSGGSVYQSRATPRAG
jgi:hypothetical protein